jgi:2-polyprenyl-6-methoxyphenol hydroxylase-like FAD-dependent oxidoreductase
MEAEVVDLLIEDGEVRGVAARTPKGTLEVRAPLTIGADGRGSVVRERAGLRVEDIGAPIDVLWMRLSRRADDPEHTFAYVRAGHVLAMLERGEYWQCAFVIPKGGYDELRRQGLETLQRTIATMVPFLRERAAELASWDQVKLLTVKIDRLREWSRSGLLCIGDAAHAMSPLGGVGINLAVQDAVAAANLLCEPLRRGGVTEGDLRAVQRRRELVTRATQRAQAFMQERVLTRVHGGGMGTLPRLGVRLLRGVPYLRRIPAWLIGVGVRPEHVRTPDAFS